jgi:multidrug efflux pump
VTLFGVFLTPLFFYVIDALGDASLLRLASLQWFGAVLLSGAVGLLCDLLAWAAGVRAGPWALIGGFALGFLAAVLVQGAHRRRKQAAARAATLSIPDQPNPERAAEGQP